MWFKVQNNQVVLYVYAKPNAKKSAIIGVKENEIHIALHAKPTDGEANVELVAFLADVLKLPKSQVILQKGQTSRHKQVVVPDNLLVQQILKGTKC